MTAEQVLIEENKKDQRVRYLSYNPHKEKIALWSEKPDFDTDDYEFWGSPSSHLGKIPFFSTPDAEYILCIDDIKEVPPIPEKWYMPVNEKTIPFINKARGYYNKGSIYNSELKHDTYQVIVMNSGFLIGSNLDYSCSIGREKITLEQFKKYVLKEQPEEKKVTLQVNDEIVKTETVKLNIEPSINIFSEFLTQQTVRYFSERGIPIYDVLKNHLDVSVDIINNMISCNKIQLGSFFIHLGEYIDNLKKGKKEENFTLMNNEKNIMANEESEKEEFGGVEFKGRYVKTGRIEVPNSFDNSFESHGKPTKPEVKTLYPRRMWIEDRLNAINQSVKSYLDNDYCIPPDWIEERNELIEQLNNLQDGKRKKM